MSAVYQQHKASHQQPGGLLHPLSILSQGWDDLTTDFVEGLPVSRGVDIILVVDRLSKYAHFLPLHHPFLALSVAELFIKDIVCLHGFPSSIVSNYDRNFMSIL